MERERILKGFEEMRGVLDREERKELYSLEEDEVNVQMNLAVARDEVVQQRQYMQELISDLQRHMCESSLDMLQVGLGTELLHMRFRRNREIKFPSLLGPYVSSSLKGFFDPLVLLRCHSFHGSSEKHNVKMDKGNSLFFFFCKRLCKNLRFSVGFYYLRSSICKAFLH